MSEEDVITIDVENCTSPVVFKRKKVEIPKTRKTGKKELKPPVATGTDNPDSVVLIANAFIHLANAVKTLAPLLTKK